MSICLTKRMSKGGHFLFVWILDRRRYELKIDTQLYYHGDVVGLLLELRFLDHVLD